MTRPREIVLTGLMGVLLGFVLSRIGFSSWDEVHRMFTFQDLRLTLTFGGAVVALGIAWIVITRTTGATWGPRRFHRGTLVGGALFGAGWAIAGACPGIVLVQVGEGQLGALCTLGGIVLGNAIYAFVHERWLRFPAQSCNDD